MKHVLILGKISDEAIDLLDGYFRVTILENPTIDAIISVIPKVDAILHKIGKLPEELLNKATNLKIVARHGVGLDDIDITYLYKNNINLTTTHDINTDSVAEFAIMLILSISKRLKEATEMMKNGIWNREFLMGSNIKGKTVGIIGYGKIGNRVARLIKEFGANILIYDPYITVKDNTIIQTNLNELLKSSDIVTIHCPLNPQTNKLINSEKLNLLKSTAYLINTARGEIVDEDELFSRLKQNKIKGAATDVYRIEPPNLADEIRNLPNLILTPHISAMTDTTQRNMALAAAQEIIHFFRK